MINKNGGQLSALAFEQNLCNNHSKYVQDKARSSQTVQCTLQRSKNYGDNKEISEMKTLILEMKMPTDRLTSRYYCENGTDEFKREQ